MASWGVGSALRAALFASLVGALATGCASAPGGGDTPPTRTPTASVTATPASPTPTFLATATFLPTVTFAPTESPSPTRTRSASPTRSLTPTPTHTPTPSITPTTSPSPTITATPSASPTPSNTPTPTASATATVSPTTTPTPTVTPTPSHTPTPSASATASASATPTASPTPSSSPTPSISPTSTATATASRTPSATATATATATPTPPIAFVQSIRDGDDAESGLDGLRAVSVSPDRRFVYGVAAGDGALSVFARDAAGTLAFVESLDGLGEASAVVVSPDALHVYAALTENNAIGVWSRTSSGRLVAVERVQDGSAGLDGLAEVRGLAVSPDGRHLYAAGFGDDAVAVLARDPIRGRLSFIERLTGLAGAAGVAVSPDGANVYVANFLDDSLATFRRDPQSGRLTGLGLRRDGVAGVDGLAAVSAVEVSPDGLLVYAVGSSALAIFERNQTTGALTFREAKRYFAPAVLCPLAPTAAVHVDLEHRNIYVARALDAVVAHYERDPNSGALVLRGTYADDNAGRSCDGALSFASVAEAGAQQVYASGLAEDRLTVLAASDDLTFLAEHRNGAGGVEGLAGASALAVSPDDRHVYAAGAAGGLAAFARDTIDGSVRFLDAYHDGSDGVQGLGGVSTIALDPDGRNVYFATSGDVLGVFTRDIDSGRLTFLEQQRNGVAGVAGLAGTSRLRLSGDGRYVYVASQGDNAVAVFARNLDDGRLTFVEQQREDVGGVDGIAEASAVALSPNGAHVYVTGAPGTVAVFTRDPDSGRLTWVTAYRNRSGGIDGLAGAGAIEVSPDGSHVYVAGFLDAAVAIFARDAASGRLGFVDVVRDGSGRLAGLRDLTLDAFGLHLYTVTQTGVLATFERRAGLGSLTAIDFQFDGQAGVDGLGGASAVTTSADARSVYGAGATDAALAVFQVAE